MLWFRCHFLYTSPPVLKWAPYRKYLLLIFHMMIPCKCFNLCLLDAVDGILWVVRQSRSMWGSIHAYGLCLWVFFFPHLDHHSANWHIMVSWSFNQLSAAWAVSAYYAYHRVWKPFNPILGETYEMVNHHGITFLAEQVSGYLSHFI